MECWRLKGRISKLNHGASLNKDILSSTALERPRGCIQGAQLELSFGLG